MSCLGVHFALSPADRERVLDARDQAALKALVQEDIEERYLGDEPGWAYQTDKAWDAIHRCLTDGTLDPDSGSHPLNLCVLGGTHLYSKDDYIICFVEPGEAREIAVALKGVTKDALRANYYRIDPSDYGLPLSEEDFEYTWAYFEGLRVFFEKAAGDGRAVLFTADQ